MISHYNYSEVVNWLQQKARMMYHPDFEFSENDLPTVVLVAAYFLRDPHVCAHYKVNLNKGILLTGPIGSGKTILFELMRYLMCKENKFIIKTCRSIVFEFIEHGYDVIHTYSRGDIYRNEPKNFCFDDLGVENNIKYFGNECNVLGEILINRYELFIKQGVITHITTNLTSSEIETFYGNRVRSRLREMFNLVAISPKTEDKRK